MSERVEIRVDGRPIPAAAGSNLAAALLASGVPCRISPAGEPRGPLCGMGTCFECRVTIDGEPHRRACRQACATGLDVTTVGGTLRPGGTAPPSTDRRAEIAVVGAGPAGLSAAVAAAETGRRVLLVDDNHEAGGQIWRRGRSGEHRSAGTWRARAEQAGVELLCGCGVVGGTGTTLLASGEGGACRIHADRVVIATGARERFLPFPGWTLPGVLGAGGAQALVEGGLDVRGRRVAVAGTGPLLLQVAASLRRHGAHVVALAEQAPRTRAAAFALGLWRDPSKLGQLLALAPTLLATRPRHSSWPLRAEGDRRLERVVLRDRGRDRELACELLACGFGLVPDTTLATLLGCALDPAADEPRVATDELQRTSVESIFCAGEPTGIGGVQKSLIEGRIAGLAAAGDERAARALVPRARRTRAFAVRLARAFALRAELRDLPADDTIVCRCEDVRWRDLRATRNARDAKLKTRCGMGACQGRVCGPALAFLAGHAPPSPRPPLFPTPLHTLATLFETDA